jgi:hypothetical protein
MKPVNPLWDTGWQLSGFSTYPQVMFIITIQGPEMGRTCSMHEEKRNAYRILVGKQEGMRPLGRPRRRCEDNIRMDLREIGLGGMDWIDLAQDGDQWRALVNTVMKLWVPQNVGKFLNS